MRVLVRMNRLAQSLALPLLLLAACNPSDEEVASGGGTDTETATAPTPSEDAQTAGPASSPTPTDDGVNDGRPDLTPAALTPEAERTETGARNVLISFARAIELKEFDQAWRMLDAQSRERWSRAEFSALFSDLGQITVAVPGGTMEGAAGSSYYNAPMTIAASDADGRPVRYDGEVVLRRANDVPGASADDLRWHIERVEMDWTH